MDNWFREGRDQILGYVSAIVPLAFEKQVMAPQIEMQEVAGADYEFKAYLSEEESGMTASLAPSDSNDVSSSSTLLDSETENKSELIDIEKAATEALSRQSARRTTRTQLLLWMTLNTVATVSIVRPYLVRNRDQDSRISGLYE